MNSKTIENILKFTVFTSLFAVLFVPLYVENHFFFPFITGKGFLFRILTEIAFASWIILFMRNRDYLPKWSSIQVSFTLFTTIILVADILGLNFLRSFWSNFERMDGFVGLIHLWGYFMVLTSVMSYRVGDFLNWRRYLNTSIFVSIIISIYSLFQLLGLANIHQGSTRLDASLGNAIYLAAYLLFHVFIAIYLAFDSAERRNKVLVWFYSALSVVFAFFMYETATRGAVLGALVGLVVGLIVLSIWSKKEDKTIRYSSIGILLFLFISISIFWLNKDSKLVQGNDILRRFASISISETKTQARGYIWPMAIKGAFENKKTTIIGLGQENFNYVFNANYNPNMWRHEQWFDRAHNSYLDWLVAGGLLGLISYLTIFIFAFLAIIKSDISINKKATLLGVIIAYGIQSIFTFDNLTSYLYFIIILSIIATQRSTKLHNWISKILLSNSNNYPIIRDYLYTPIVLMLFIITIYTINVRPIQANTRLIDAMISCSGGQNVPSVEAYQNALKLDQYVANQEIREQSLSCGTNIIRSNLPQSAKETFAYFVVTNIDKQINITPNDARAFYLGGTFLDEAGNWSAANVLLERANQLSPNKQSIMLELATNYINSNRMSDAVEITKKAYELATDNDISRAAYISVLIVSGQEGKAKEVFLKQPEAFYDERIVNAYMNKKQFDKAAQIYKKLIENNPENKQYYLQLAGVYFASGNKYSTIQELKLIGDKFPESKKQIDDAIKEVEKKLQ